MASRKLNAKFLLIALGALVVLGAAVHVLHLVQLRRLAQNLLAQVNQFEAVGEVERSLDALKRYLFFAPTDTPALARYGQRLDESAKTMPERLRVAQVLEQVVQREPGQQAVRRRLVEILLASDIPYAARRHLELLVKSYPNDGVLRGQLGQALEADGEDESAVEAYQDAVKLSPQNIDSAVRLAYLLHRLERVERAGRVLNAMVEANPRSVSAHLERATYRMRNGNPVEAGEDLAQARELAPADTAVLRASAQWCQTQGQWDQARKYWEQGLKAAPGDLTLHQGLGHLELQLRRPAQAVTCLRAGLQQLPDQPELLFLLAEARLQVGELDAVEDDIKRLRGHADHTAAADYLQGRLLVLRHEWPAAMASLEKALSQASLMLGAAIQVSLGDCWAGLNNPDRQLAAYQKAVELDPGSLDGRLGLAATLLAQNRVEQALEQYVVLAALPQPPDSIWLPYAQTLYQHQLAMPRGKRDWAELENLLARAAAVKGHAAATAVLRAEVLLTQEKPDQARAVLEEALKDHPKEVNLWLAQIRLARWQGERDRAQDLLARARQQLGDRADLLLEGLASRERPEARTASSLDAGASLKALEAKVSAQPAADQARALCQLAAAAYRLGKPAEGEKLCRLSLQHPASLQDRVLLLDLVLEAGQEQLVEEVGKDLHRLEGPDDTWSRYARAMLGLLRLARGSDTLEEVRSLLAQVMERRPDWSRAVLLQAQVDDLDGKKPAALAGYLRAFDLGERQPALVQRLVQLLLARDRDLEADGILRRYQQQGLPQGNLARLAADIALRVRHYDRALTLAQQVHPAPGQESRHHLWLGQILTAAGRLTEAEVELREALRLGTKTPEPWLAMVELLVRNSQQAEAERLLQGMAEQLPPAEREVALATGEEILGHFDKAEQLYRAALKDRPTDGEVLQRAAQFFGRLDRKREAEQLLRRLLDPAGFVPDDALPAVRRRLAVVLAFAGDEGKYREALALLDQNGKEGEESVADQRARALVQATRPDQRPAALRTVELTGKQLPLSADEHYRLAMLYEKEKNGSVARQQMLNALALDRNNPVYLAHHIRNLLDAGHVTEAQPWIDSLARIEPESARVKAFQARLRQ